MQLLTEARKEAPVACAQAVLKGVPPVMWFIRRRMRRHRAPGLSVPQFRMLVLVDSQPTLSLSEAAQHLGVSLPGASRMISGLVGRRLVERKPCSQDRRQIALELTRRGRAALRSARQATQEHLARELAGLDEAQQQAVCEGMQVLQSVFGKFGD
jgi:DNA-binding MarR family transcriptional regulator